MVGGLGWSENWPSPTIGSFYAYPSKRNFHTKFHQNWMKIVKVSQYDAVVRGVGWLGWSENWSSPTIGSFYAYPSNRNFHTKFHQNWMKIVEVSQSHVVGRGVGWLGWSNFFYRLISQADHQDKAPYKISTQYLKAFKSYPIVKFAPNRRHTESG